MKGQALEPMKRREERKKFSLLRSKNQRESSGKNRARIPRGYQGFGILRSCSTARMILRQLKKCTKKHKKRRTNMSFSITQWCRKEPMAWRVTIHEQEDGTSRNPERRTIKGSSWENFQPIRNGFSSLGTNDKKKDSQKLSLKR